MKESVSPKIIIGVVAVLVLVIGFVAYRMMAPEKSGTTDAAKSAQYNQRSSGGYGQPPAGMSRPVNNGNGRPQGSYGSGSQPGSSGGGYGGR